MFQFDWTITLGNLVSTTLILASFIGGAYRFVYNHLAHLEDAIQLGILQARKDLKDHMQEEREFFITRFEAIDKDIRELRDWTIVMRGKRTQQ